MEFATITFPNIGIAVPMVKHPEYGLLATSPIICLMLGITTAQLKMAHKRHMKRLPTLRVTNCYPKEDVLQYKSELGFTRFRDDAILWPVDSMLRLLLHVTSPRIDEIHDRLVELMKAGMEESMSRRIHELEQETALLRERANADKAVFEARLQALEESARIGALAATTQASYAGKTLAAAKGTKGIRGLN